MRLLYCSHTLRFSLVTALLATCVPIFATAETKHSIKNYKPEVLDMLPGEVGVPEVGNKSSAAMRKVRDATFGAFTSIQVNVGQDINNDPVNITGDAANEPSITVDPNNPLRMAIGWRQFATITNNFRQAGVAYSDDGGRTWTFPGPLDPSQFRSDPVLNFDSNGTFYYLSLTNDFTMDMFQSTNGGATWGAPVPAHGGDKQWLAIDRTGGIGHGHLYSTWSLFAGCCGNNIYTRSANGGVSYEAPITIPSTPIFGTLDVAPDGTLYVVGVDPGDFSRFLVSRSSNAQDTGQLTSFTTVSVNMGGSASLGSPGDPNPAGFHGQPWIVVDHSGGPRNGWLYVLGTVDPTSADPLDIHFSRSTNGGASWSAPVKLNTDPTTSSWQWFGTMSIAPNGRLDVVWNDTRNSFSSNLSELFYTSSSDGGVTWTPNQQLSPMWDSHIGWPMQNKIGDYYDMISDDVGAHLAWAATFNGEQDVYYLRIGDYDCNVNGVGDSLDIASGTSTDFNTNGIPDECENITLSDAPTASAKIRLQQNVPNPFNPGTTISFEMSQIGIHAKLDVFTVDGRHVRSLFDAIAVAGANEVRWNGLDDQGTRVGSGVYLYRLVTPDFSETRRMLLVK